MWIWSKVIRKKSIKFLTAKKLMLKCCYLAIIVIQVDTIDYHQYIRSCNAQIRYLSSYWFMNYSSMLRNLVNFEQVDSSQYFQRHCRVQVFYFFMCNGYNSGLLLNMYNQNKSGFLTVLFSLILQGFLESHIDQGAKLAPWPMRVPKTRLNCPSQS